MTSTTPANIKTRFLIVSDTHGLDSLPDPVSSQYVDVAIHCGDLTAESNIDEYQASIRLLQAVNAPLKLVIAGNHDFTLDIPVYGCYGDARRMLEDAAGITFLDEGTYSFRLQNGAFLKVYASPYTPTLGEWGFQYHPDRGHDFSIHNVDVAMTHGPPKGVMDYTYAVIDKLSTLNTVKSFSATSHCFGDKNQLQPGSQTLFVNASIEGAGEFPTQPPWLVELELPSASDQEN
ncbi:hypothetical protein N7520_008554 [Penicillium odoratum]|uniref:uncharacterized protein n=1 Tax=Penicillium odoratum TaxID=1167516 RepID=UPI00254665DF|nr:uncharacterized protein N7520_008554 [Penicillium odoratum]KAJ5751637.1 hypothetical protein N7520_008554 [Penicillium odoratum]